MYEKDVFDIDLASNKPPVHKPSLDADRGEVRGAYAVVTLTNGDVVKEWMPKAELDKAMSHTRMMKDGRIYGPWEEWAGEMSKKSVIRRMAKRLPLDPAVQVLMAQDQASDYSPRPDPEAAIAAAEALDISGVKEAAPSPEGEGGMSVPNFRPVSVAEFLLGRKLIETVSGEPGEKSWVARITDLGRVAFEKKPQNLGVASKALLKRLAGNALASTPPARQMNGAERAPAKLDVASPGATPKAENPKPDFKPVRDASDGGPTGKLPASPEVLSSATAAVPRGQAGPTITGGQASLLRHLMEQAKLTDEAGTQFLMEKAKVSRIEDLTPAAYKAVLAEVQSRVAA